MIPFCAYNSVGYREEVAASLEPRGSRMAPPIKPVRQASGLALRSPEDALRPLGTGLAPLERMQEMRASEVASQLVESLDYPVTKDVIIAAAREATLGSSLEEALKKLPDREYADAEELTRAINAT